MAERALVDLRRWMLERGLEPALSGESMLRVPGLDPEGADADEPGSGATASQPGAAAAPGASTATG
jgi:hypothetical protein